MNQSWHRIRVIVLILLTALTYAALAQTTDPANALTSAVGSWPLYHGDYSGRRHSPLTQITPANVRSLTLAWAFDTHQTPEIKSSPLVVNGTLYLSTPDNVWAVDARTGVEIWHYTYPPNSGSHIGNRGVAFFNDYLYFTTPDNHLVSLDARNGTLRWNVVLADVNKGYWTSVAPLIAHGHVLVGTSGDFDNLPGMLKAMDPETGALQWTFYSTPPPESGDRSSGGATGGNMWITGTYDPDLNLVYVGTGNPTPVLAAQSRPGDNPWTCSIVALNPDTGKLVWGFQASPHDTHDWDAVEVPVLIDGIFNRAPRKMLLQASRNGFFFVLDRSNGKNLLTGTFAAVNWAKGVDADGRPIGDPAKAPARDGRLVAPDEGGATNYRSPSFDPQTGLFIVSSRDAYGIYFSKPEHGTVGWAGADYGIFGRAVLRSLDYQTGKIRWSHDLHGGGAGAGVLTTDSGLTFTGDATRNVIALRTSDGTTLWHSSIGRVGNSPITYELAGRQYIVIASGGVLFAWTLPIAEGMEIPTS